MEILNRSSPRAPVGALRNGADRLVGCSPSFSRGELQKGELQLVTYNTPEIIAFARGRMENGHVLHGRNLVSAFHPLASVPRKIFVLTRFRNYCLMQKL